MTRPVDLFRQAFFDFKRNRTDVMHHVSVTKSRTKNQKNRISPNFRYHSPIQHFKTIQTVLLLIHTKK